jgi:fructokinase
VLTKDELEDIIYFSNAAGSLTTAKIDTIPALPTLEEIENCQKNIASFLNSLL